MLASCFVATAGQLAGQQWAESDVFLGLLGRFSLSFDCTCLGPVLELSDIFAF